MSLRTRADFRSFSRWIAICARCAASSSRSTTRVTGTSPRAKGLHLLAASRNALAPSDARLVYDRLGMIVCFAAIVAMLLAERLDVHVLPWLLTIGVASIVWWQLTGDLRPYGFVQFFPMILIVLLLVMSKARFTHTWTIVAMGILYAVAKVLELTDVPIYRALGVSGHTLKHIVAGAGTGMIAWWVWRRTPVTSG